MNDSPQVLTKDVQYVNERGERLVVQTEAEKEDAEQASYDEGFVHALHNYECEACEEHVDESPIVDYLVDHLGIGAIRRLAQDDIKFGRLLAETRPELR